MPTTDHVLIIEEEALLALDIEYVLSEHGAFEVTHFRSVAEAHVHLSDPSVFRLAFVEARLGAAEVVELTERLVRAGVATIVMSADSRSLDLFPHATPLEKPFDSARLLAACDAARSSLN